jgi:hypothetical protein
VVDGYHGQPLLKPPVWTWEVPTYFFVGGAAGVAALIAAVAAIAGVEGRLVRDARSIALAGALISPALLVSDLGRPARFINMFRVFKVQSPMSMGAWTLGVFTPAVLIAWLWGPGAGEAGASFLMGVLGHVGSVVGAATGLVLATYTGVLIGVTTVPVWAAHARTLPLHFGASALGAAVSILELCGHVTPALNALGAASAAGVTVAWLSLETARHPVSKTLTSGASGGLTRMGHVLSGPLPLLLRLVWASSPMARLVAAVVTIAGSLVAKFGWIAAGKASIAAAVVLAVVLTGAQAPRVDLSPKALAAAASRYVVDYREEFKFLLAEERYTQRVFTVDGRLTRQRDMKGEMYLAFIPADGEWISVHDIMEVDGAPLRNRDDLRQLMRHGDVRGAAMRVANRNATFNIGRLGRNFNEPMLPLLLLDPKRLKTLDIERRSIVQAGDRTRVELGYKEKQRPTLVRSTTGPHLYGTGTFTVEPVTGRIEKTVYEIKDKGVSSRLVTEYALEPRLNLWVPVLFREFYESSWDGKPEIIRCEATYTNYARFEVTGRIK